MEKKRNTHIQTCTYHSHSRADIVHKGIGFFQYHGCDSQVTFEGHGQNQTHNAPAGNQHGDWLVAG